MDSAHSVTDTNQLGVNKITIKRLHNMEEKKRGWKSLEIDLAVFIHYGTDLCQLGLACFRGPRCVQTSSADRP